MIGLRDVSRLVARADVARRDASGTNLQLVSTVRQGWGFGLKSLTHPRWLLAEDAPLIVDDLLCRPSLWASRRLHLAINKHTDLAK